MRKSELMLKMRRTKSIKFPDLDAWLFCFGFNQPGMLGFLYLLFLFQSASPAHG
jgi:hypothetical protein